MEHVVRRAIKAFSKRLRTPHFARFFSWIMQTFPFSLPVHRLKETSSLLAFYHPDPSYPYHVLLVPKKPVATLSDLDPADSAFLTDLFSTVQQLVAENHLPAYRLIVNGGEYQDFPYLHFHLVA
jgi:histidine triad (HIT) family protein